MENYKGKAKNNVLAYIVKTSNGDRVRIFYTLKEANDFIFDLLRHGCNQTLHIEEFTN